MKIKTIIKNKMNERLMYKYPLFVCYPRSGTHWVNYVMESYFERPRALSGGISPLDQNRKDYMWISSHDFDLNILKKISKIKDYKFKKVLYLYRNPFDVIFSFVNFNVQNPNESPYFNYKTKEEGFSDESIMKHFDHWKKHKEFYLNSELVIPINYDKLMDINTRVNEFKKITDFFGYELNKEKLNKIFEDIKNKNMSEWTGPRGNKLEKEEFKKKWESKLK